MTILQKPDDLSLLGNLKKLILQLSSTSSVKLESSGRILLESTYDAGPDGKASIDFKEIITQELSFILKTDNFYEQTNIVKAFTCTVDGAPFTFTVIRAGISDLADTPTNWLTQNFLTWQPQYKPVTYYSPEFITCYAVVNSTLKLKAHYSDGTNSTISLGSLVAGKAYTANLQYAVVAGLLGQKYPSYFDVWTEDNSGNRLSYIQRYYFSEVKSEQEQWFLFENSLGGIDTLRAYGDTDFQADHAHKIARSSESLSEYQIDTVKNYSKNTGYLDEYERKWLLDFFPSIQKFVHFRGAFRPIVVTESDVKYAASDLPSDYTFKYRFASETNGLLNLVRNESTIPAEIVIPNLDAPDFYLPPRLAEFPRTLNGGAIIPAFDPYTNQAQTTTIGAIVDVAAQTAVKNIPGAGEGATLVQVLDENSNIPATNKNVYSALRVLKEIIEAIDVKGAEKFLSKINPDTAKSLIKFLDGIEIGTFVPGMFGGKGGKIDKDGNAEMTSLRLRELLEVPELRYNRLTVIGDEFILTENGLIQSVEQIADRSYQVNMKLEEGEAIAFIAGDLIKGIFHHTGGFATSHLRIEEVGETFMKVTLVADADTLSGFNLPPQPYMNIARVGHVSDKNRQRYMVFSSKLGGYQLYDGASDFKNAKLVASFDTAQSFQSMYDNLPLKEGLPYVYAAGLIVEDIVRVNYQGVPSREIHDRGLWQSDTTYYNDEAHGTDDVWHLGCRWRCFSSSTTEEPAWTSAAWYMIEGRSDARMEFDSSNGFSFFAGAVDTVITPIVFIGNTNVSDDIVNEQWKWQRQSGDATADAVWNAQHPSGRLLTLKNEDMGAKWSRESPVRFICIATYPASSINNITSYIQI